LYDADGTTIIDNSHVLSNVVTWTGTDLKLDTNFDTNNGLIALKTYNFKVKIRSHLDKRTAIKQIITNLGCYGEKELFVAPKKNLPTAVKAWEMDGAVLKFKGNLCNSGESNANIYNTLINLNYALDWTSDIKTCGLGKLSLYTDEALTTQTSGAPVDL